SLMIGRISDFAMIMVTFGLCLLLYEFANKAHWLTGGDDGLQGVRMWPLFDMFRFDLYGRTAYAYSLVVLFGSFLILRRLINSPFGLSLRGIRENARRMPAIGSPSSNRIRTVYIISGAFARIARGLSGPTTPVG